MEERFNKVEKNTLMGIVKVTIQTNAVEMEVKYT